MSWDPEQYSRFADERGLPLGDLLAGVPEFTCNEVLDLGCGSGVAIPLLRRRWPQAHVTAVDNSAEMLAAVKNQGNAETRLIEADIADYAPDRAFDLILSNAALHWLDDHETLFPRLLGWLAPGGILAVQMPNNWAEPSHRLLAEIAGDDRWREKLAPLLRPAPVGDGAFYQALLEPLCQSFETWEKFYTHRVEGEDAVYRWLAGTSLKPLLDALDGEECAAFAGRYREALAAAYPPDEAGITEFPFRRMFILATSNN
jgi:trans-aconitate 2-methyltransferase